MILYGKMFTARIKKSPATTYFSAVGSIIGAKELNFRVRDGNGWVLFAMVTGQINKLIFRSQPLLCLLRQP